MQLEIGTDDDHRTARVVDALAKQILAEASLLALKRVRERLQRTVISAAQNASTAAVIKESIDCFLEHALFIAHDHLRSMQIHQLLETVVAVNNTAIKIVEI